MSLYTKDSIDRLKDAVDMVELVGARTDLRRVGTRFTGLCPFHEERTPSFSVNAEHKLYHCFGCGESGDCIRFVQETEAEWKRALVSLHPKGCCGARGVLDPSPPGHEHALADAAGA